MVASGHGVGALKGDHGGEAFSGRAIGLAEVAVEHGAFVVDLHALEGRPRHLPGFVESLAHLAIAGHHARVSDGLRPAGFAIEGGRLEVILVRGHLAAFGGELVGHALVLLGHAGPLGDPGVEVKRLHPLGDFELIRIAGINRSRQANFQLSAAGHSVSEEELGFRSSADLAKRAGLRAGILSERRRSQDLRKRNRRRGDSEFHQVSSVEQ